MRNLLKLSTSLLFGVKQIRFYIADFVGDGLTVETAFKPLPITHPALKTIKINWIDGRPIGNVVGKCLVWADITPRDHLKMARYTTYLPLEGPSGLPLGLSARVSAISESNLAIIIAEFDTLLIPRDQVFLTDDIASLLSRVQQRFRLSQILREDDLRIPLGQTLSTAERNKLGQRVGSVIKKGQTAGEVIEYIIKDKRFDFHV